MINLDKALSIVGWMKPAELTWLAEHASNADIAVEIGSWQGRSTRALGDHIQQKVFAVDCLLTDARMRYPRKAHKARSAREQFFRNLDDLLKDGRVVLIDHNSQNGLPPDLYHLLGCVDLLFIDGDHSEGGVRSDIKYFGPLVRPGGIISGHDYSHVKHPGVKIVVDEYFPQAQFCESIWWTTAS